MAETVPLRTGAAGSGVIDLHAHLLTETYRNACLAAGHDRPDGTPGLPTWSPAAALTLMDETGIDAAVLSVSSPGVYFGDVGAAIELCAAVNDEAAQVVRDQPGRFGFAASLPLPSIDAAIGEARRAYRDLNADAISLHTNYGGLYLGDSSLDPLLAVLDSLNAVVLLHPTSPPCWQEVSFGRPRPMVEFLFDTTRAVVNLALSGALNRYPGIRWVVPHTGGALPVMADRVHQFALAWAASAADRVDVLGALQRLYYDVAGVATPRALPALLQLVGSGQIVYGSDYPFTPPPLVRRLAQELADADPAELQPLTATLRANAEKLFPRFGAQPAALAPPFPEPRSRDQDGPAHHLSGLEVRECLQPLVERIGLGEHGDLAEPGQVQYLTLVGPVAAVRAAQVNAPRDFVAAEGQRSAADADDPQGAVRADHLGRQLDCRLDAHEVEQRVDPVPADQGKDLFRGRVTGQHGVVGAVGQRPVQFLGAGVERDNPGARGLPQYLQSHVPEAADTDDQRGRSRGQPVAGSVDGMHRGQSGVGQWRGGLRIQ